MAQFTTLELSKSQRRFARTTVAVGYCRRSTDRQEQSIPDQKAAIEKYARERHLKMLRFYIDDAISGTSTVGRKAFQQLIDDAKRPSCEFGQVIVYDVKRFGRIDNDEAGYYRHILKTHGVEVLYVTENFTGDRTDDLLRPVKQWQAREESKDLSKVVMRGLLSRVASSRSGDASGRPAGWWIGGVPPHGYDLRYENQAGEFLFYLRYQPDCTKQMFNKKWKLIRTIAKGESVSTTRKDRAKLVSSTSERVKVVQRIFKLFAEEGRGFKSIAQTLNAEGAVSPRNPQWYSGYRGLWGMSSIRSIVTNPAYVGDMVWNKRSDGKFHKIAKGMAVERKDLQPVRLKWNDEENWLVVPNAHEPLISRRIWELAKQLLKGKPESEFQRGVNPRTGELAGVAEDKAAITWMGPRARFLLSGLIACTRCGNRYEGRVNYGKRSEDERRERKRTYVYACGGHIRFGRRVCTLGAIPQPVLEGAVIEALIGFYSQYAEHDGKQKLSKALNLHAGQSQDELRQRRKSLQASLKKIEKVRRNLVDNITAANRDLVDVRLVELARDHEQQQAELSALEHLALSTSELQALLEETIQFVSDLGQVLQSGGAEQRHTAMRRCVAKIEVDPEAGKARMQLRLVPAVGSGLMTPTEWVTAIWA